MRNLLIGLLSVRKEKINTRMFKEIVDYFMRKKKQVTRHIVFGTNLTIGQTVIYIFLSRYVLTYKKKILSNSVDLQTFFMFIHSKLFVNVPLLHNKFDNFLVASLTLKLATIYEPFHHQVNTSEALETQKEHRRDADVQLYRREAKTSPKGRRRAAKETKCHNFLCPRPVPVFKIRNPTA